MRARNYSKQSAFTLIEVLFTIAVAAMLMSTISLNLGVRESLIKTANTPSTKAELSVMLDQIVRDNTLVKLEELIGTESNTMPDSVTAQGQFVVSIANPVIDTNNGTRAIELRVERNGVHLSRWLAPSDQ